MLRGLFFGDLCIATERRVAKGDKREAQGEIRAFVELCIDKLGLQTEPPFLPGSFHLLAAPQHASVVSTVAIVLIICHQGVVGGQI